MLDSGSWVPQAEDRLTSQVNAAAAESAAPDFMTAEQADVAEAQQSVMAETQFGRSVGIRPDYSQPPAKDPAEDEPKTINDLRKRQQDLYNDPSYDMPFEEWQDFTRWKNQNESEVGSFIGGIPGMAESLGQLGAGLVKERAQQLYRATAGLDPIGAAATEVATFKEMGRKIGVGLTQLSDWVGGKVSDIVESGRRVGQVQQNVIQALRDNGQLTGDPLQDNTTIQKALEEAAAQGMYEPTQQQAEEDDEVGYQRYQRKKAYDREYSGITQFSIGGSRMSLPDVRETVTMPTLLPNTQQSKGVNAERQVFQPQEATSTVGAMAFSPENALPVGIGVLARARMLRRLASITGTPLKATETAMASIDDWMARTADRVTSKIPIVGDLPLRQRAYTLGAAGGVGAYLDATTDSPVIDVVAKPLIFAGAVLPTAKLFGGTLRRVGAGAGAGWQVIKEMDAGAVGSARAETAARMAASGKFNPRYSKYMERGAQGGVESTLRRVSNNPEMPETLRRIARSADNIGITQVARGIDDAVSSSVAAGIAATPFALAAPDSETAGGIVGGAVLLGGTLGTAGRVIGRRSARTDADIARMMVDVEMAGGDAGSLGALSYSGLDLLAAMQGITSGKVDFVPLRAQEYRANADVRASGGETVAGLHIEKAADGRAKVYVNMGHTAPIAGRVSIKPIQITRNGKTEDANVVRIKGEDGQSDFTVVPREYPLLVKSGDIVEPNARLARGLSPTHVMPHEIGHAILTSSILNGSIRDDLRNLVNQRYDTAGVEARGREYVTRIVDKDILAGAHDQLPDKLTQQEFDDIASGRRTMADVLKGKPVSDAQREAMITDRYNEMRERSIADGNNPDGLDVFRDEIVAETFSSLSDSLDFRRMRAGGPQVMESVLSATARVFETMGVKFDRSTGKLMDNPSVVFRDNPLMQDPIMRKRMQEHLRNYEAWMLGMEQAGAREQKGTQISVDGSAESARRSTHTKLRANDNGVLENDLIYIDQNGQAQWKPQKMLDEQEKGRSAQVGQLYDKNKILPPNSAEFGLRRAGAGRTVISGPTLPAKFDVLRWFPKHIREMARMLEAGREGGSSHIFDYNTIGTGEGGRYRVINRGDVRAIIREGAFLGWEATKNGHLKAVVMDLNAFRSAAMRAINRGELGIFNNDMSQLQADLMVYLANHKNGLPGEATIGQQKRDMLNGLIGTGTAVQRDINPLYADLNPRGSVRSFRFDRINDITPTGRDGYHFDYDKLKHNRMPSALPQSGMAMPDGPVAGSQGMPEKIRAYRGISKSQPFNDSGTTWLTTSRDAAESYAKEVHGYEDPAVLEVLVDPSDIPVYDIRKLSEEQLNALEPDQFGNPQKIGIYRNSDDSMLGGSGAGTVMHVPRDKVTVVGESPRPTTGGTRGQAMPDAAVTQDGLVQAPEDAPKFKLPRQAMAQFMPDTGVDLDDYADRTILALPADRMGIGSMMVGPKGKEREVSVKGQGGAGFMEIYNGGGWAFSDEATGNRFMKRLREAAEPGESSVLVGITAMSEFNHLKNQTGQLAYVEALEAAIAGKSISKKQADAHIKAISQSIVQSTAKSVTDSTRRKFAAIKNFNDFAKAVRNKSLNFADAAPYSVQIARRALPIPYKEAKDIGIAFDDIGKQTADPRYADVPFGTVVALLEVPLDQAPVRSDFHYSYPFKVTGRSIGFLKKYYNVGQLTSDPRIRNSAGAVQAQPLQTVLPKLDQLPRN